MFNKISPKTFGERVIDFEESSRDKKYTITSIVNNLQKDNEELAQLYQEIEEEIQSLKMIQIKVSNIIAENQAMINSLEEFVIQYPIEEIEEIEEDS